MISHVVCGAGPASHAGNLIALAQAEGWQVQVIATPPALAFLDCGTLEKQTGFPVRSEYQPPGSARSPLPDVIIVAPATYNTICKWALGISDTYALGVLAETTGMGIPAVVLPFVNSALAARKPFVQAIESLREEGVRILLGPGSFEPHTPRTGGNKLTSFPWHLALAEADKATHQR